jgi:DNA-binding response OmpR family regulator
MARLMLVDDEPEVVNLLSVILTMYGFEVVGFTRGEVALAAAREVKPDLLLVDLIMPGMDGLSLVTAFDRDPVLAGTPVLMLTGLTTGELLVGSNQRGPGIGILEKPCEPEMIAAEVTRLLGEAANLPDYRQVVSAARRSLTGAIQQMTAEAVAPPSPPPQDRAA